MSLPPPPIQVETQPQLKEWLNKLYRYVATGTGTIPWDSIDKSGSELADLASKPHSQLDAIGGSSEQQHVSVKAFNQSEREGQVTTVNTTQTLTATYGTVIVGTSGIVLTLPAASSGLIGATFSVTLGVTGYFDLKTNGSNTFNLPTTDTTIRINNKGACITLRCVSATSWNIV